MNILCRKRTLKIPAYWRFLATYISITCIIIIMLIPLYNKALSVSKQSYLNQVNYGLVQNAERMENITDAVMKIPYTMKQSMYYIKMKALREKTLKSEHYIYLDIIKKVFQEQCGLINFFDEGFLLFTNSNSAVTSTHICESIDSCFLSVFVYDDLSVENIIAKIINMENKKLVPASGISINHSNKYDNYVTLIARRQEDNVIVGALLSKSSIFELFKVYDLPEDALFYIKDMDNNIIISNNIDAAFVEKINSTNPSAESTVEFAGIKHNGVKYNTLNYTMKSLGCDVVIGIPERYFMNLLFPLRKLCSLYIILAVIIGVLLSLIFAKFNYTPLKKLVNIPLLLDYKKNESCGNEYQFLREVIEHSDGEIGKLRTEILNMNNTLRISLFMRLLNGAVNKEDERKLVSQLIPQVESEYRIIIVRLDIFNDISNTSYLSFLVNDQLSQLSQLLSSCLVSGQLDRTKTVVLIPDSPQNERILSEKINEINNKIAIYNAKITAGVSEVLIGIDRTNTAFYHAQFSLSEASTGSIQYYVDSPEIEPLSIGFTGLQRLYELIKAGKCEDVRDMLDEITIMLMSGSTYSSEDVKKVFYAICFILDSVIRDMRCKTVELPEYNENDTIQEMFDSLENTANRITLELEEREQKSNIEMKKAFIDYINSCFTNKSFYAASIANALGISESYVYKLAKEFTGYSLNDYIRKLRVEKAAEMLKTTDLLVSDISDACGFDVMKTFYRTFKKYYGVTPSEYRE